MASFCICIPCTKQHTIYLEQCLHYIENQNLHPQFVVIVCSESTAPYNFSQTYSFPIKQILSSASQCAGTNRNIGALYAKDKVPYIYFFDADDIMHPRYCETMTNFFTQHPDQTFVCPNFYLTKYHVIQDQIKHDTLPFEPLPTSSPLYKPNYINATDPSWPSVQPLENESMAKGPVAIKSEIFNTTLYKKDYGVGEDGEFLYRLINQGHQGGYIPHPLFYYIRYVV